MDLVERLRKVESAASFAGEPTTNWHRNPDGPEAADQIAILESELARVTAERDAIRAETIEECAKVCERTYSKDAFHFELGWACATAIRALGADNASE